MRGASEETKKVNCKGGDKSNTGWIAANDLLGNAYQVIQSTRCLQGSCRSYNGQDDQ